MIIAVYLNSILPKETLLHLITVASKPVLSLTPSPQGWGFGASFPLSFSSGDYCQGRTL